MDRDAMQALVEEMLQVTLNQKDVEASDRFWREDMVWHGSAGVGVLHGREAFKHDLLYPFFKAFPDYHAVNELYAVDLEKQFITAWGFFTGTHQDVWGGAAATGRPVKGGFMDIWRIQDGLLAENWVMVDVAGVLEQVGALELPATLAEGIA